MNIFPLLVLKWSVENMAGVVIFSYMIINTKREYSRQKLQKLEH